MSECVVRMEMPQDGVCDGCDARTVDFLAGPICSIKKKFLGSSRPSWCPIICQLPEGHGRLADADALKEWFIEQIDYYKRFDGPNCSMMVSAYEAVCRVINDAPTIVPAEAERNET